MEFSKKQVRPGVVILAMTGSIRVGPNCQKIEQAVDEIIRKDGTWLVLDFTGVSYIDGAGIGMIVKSLSKLKKLGGTLRLAGLSSMVAGALKLTRIDRVIEVFRTADEAAQGLPPTPVSQPEFSPQA